MSYSETNELNSSNTRPFNYIGVCLHSLAWIDWTSDLTFAPFLRSLRDKGIYFPNALAQSTNVVNSFPVEYSGCCYHRCLDNLKVDDGCPPRIQVNDSGRFVRLPPTIFEMVESANYEWMASLEGYFTALMPKILKEGDDKNRFDEIMERNRSFEEALDYMRTAASNNDPFAIFFQLYNTHRPWSMKGHPYFVARTMEELELTEPPPDDVWGARWAAINEPDNLSFIRRLGLAYADRAVAKIFEILEQSGKADDTVVLIYSNHGEVFDHFRHSKKLKHTCVSHGSVMAFDSLEHVFQIWIVPGQSQRWVTKQVRIIDIVPTIADLLNLNKPACDGTSLSGLWSGSVEEYSRDSLVLSPQAYSYRTGSYKLYYCNNDDAYFKHALFDMSWDRSERHDLFESPSHQQIITDMSLRLRSVLKGKEHL